MSRVIGAGFRLLIPMLAVASVSLASEADALAIVSRIQARHLPYGTILDPTFAAQDSGQIMTYTRCADSAIWTGHYLAAESFRYKVTGAPDAYANMLSAIAGIQSLVDVTGNNLLARCIVPLSSPYVADISSQEMANGIYTNSSAGYIWVGNTSRDEYCGVLFGLAVAYDMVGDATVQKSIAALITLIVDFLTGHDWSVVMPDGSTSTTFLVRPEEMLSFIAVGRHVNSSHFSSLSNDVQRVLLAPTTLAPVEVDVQDNSSYFKFNLDYIALYNLIRLDTSVFNDVYQEAYSILRSHTSGHQNAHFNMIDYALNGPNAGRDADTVSFLQQWLERPIRDPYVDLTGVLPACSTGEACNPVPVPQRPTTDFLWQRDPFQLAGGAYGTIEGAGIDYHSCLTWMARYYKVIAADSVTSVEPGNPLAVSPLSMASFQGAGSAQVAGIQKTDSAGNTSIATPYFASSEQVLFELPPGVAAGQATFTAIGANTGPATAIVQNVAPGLFTADGTVGGVARAQTVVIGSGGPATPVYQCSSGTCSAVPINLNPATLVLQLFGTGIRNRSSLANVNVIMDFQFVTVIYAGPSDAQNAQNGLDRVDVIIPYTLAGTGATNVVLTVDGQTATPVQIHIQ